MFQIARLSGVVLLAYGVSACALSEDTISLQYRPMIGVSEVAGAKSVGVVVSVTDARSDHRDRVSVKKNGYGMEMAAIRSDRDVSGIVKDAIEVELRARGFRVGQGKGEAKVDLITFYNDFKTGFFSGDALADVNFNVKIMNAAGAIIYSKRISSQGKVANIQLASGSNAKEALENGLQTAIANLMSDPEFIAAVLKADASAVPIS